MPRRVFLCIILLLSLRAFSQAPGSTSGGGDDSSNMQVPPSMSGGQYSTGLETEEHRNFIAGGFVVETAFDDNVVGGASPKPVSDVSVALRPTVSLNQSTGRQERAFSYSPGFVFYHPTSSLNEADQNLVADYVYRLTRHAVVSASESFQKSSNAFSSPDSGSGGPITGAGGAPAVVAPFADRDENDTGGDFSYQFSLNSMLGGSGSYSRLTYPDPKQATGLYDSTSSGGGAFFNQRFGENQYVGVKFQYLRSLALPAHAQSETETDTIFGSYTLYIKRMFSLSFSGGPQYARASQTVPVQVSSSWNPAINMGLGWRARRIAAAATYSRTVMGGGGLLGSFQSDTGRALVHGQPSRYWTVTASANYSTQKNVAPPGFVSSPGGHQLSGSLTASRVMGKHFSLNLGYSRLHQSYGGIQVIAADPDSNRESVSVSYQFTRPLGK